MGTSPTAPSATFASIAAPLTGSALSLGSSVARAARRSSSGTAGSTPPLVGLRTFSGSGCPPGNTRRPGASPTSVPRRNRRTWLSIVSTMAPFPKLSLMCLYDALSSSTPAEKHATPPTADAKAKAGRPGSSQRRCGSASHPRQPPRCSRGIFGLRPPLASAQPSAPLWRSLLLPASPAPPFPSASPSEGAQLVPRYSLYDVRPRCTVTVAGAARELPRATLHPARRNFGASYNDGCFATRAAQTASMDAMSASVLPRGTRACSFDKAARSRAPLGAASRRSYSNIISPSSTPNAPTSPVAFAAALSDEADAPLATLRAARSSSASASPSRPALALLPPR
mmetsp:Transcript_4249/g.17075  ORF Transcript_4249/g.17075 Transcript_4249/m.17075 type:complete len:340 (-) Transcript_4249:59-1078(-)